MKYFRLLLFPFSFLYWIFISVKNFLYDKDILTSYNADRKIICIGNITAGGTGKTPIAITVAKELLLRGKKIAILSRGYKRKTQGFLEVNEPNPEKFGDEPAMMFSRLPDAKIYVSEDRVYAIEKITESFVAELILMDDGLQNRKIKKDYTIAVINEENKSIFDRIYLPAGNLRESRTRLNKYNSIILNYKFSSGHDKSTEPNTYSCKYKLDGFYRNMENKISVGEVLTKKVLAFCGIADSDSFFKTLKNLGLTITQQVAFNDHHNFNDYDIDKLIQLCNEIGSEFAITTEKDFIRLTKHSKKIEQSGINFLHTKIFAEIENLDGLVSKILRIN